MEGHTVFRNLKTKTAQMQNCTTAKLHKYKTAKLQNCTSAKLQKYKTSQVQNRKTADNNKRESKRKDLIRQCWDGVFLKIFTSNESKKNSLKQNLYSLSVAFVLRRLWYSAALKSLCGWAVFHSLSHTLFLFLGRSPQKEMLSFGFFPNEGWEGPAQKFWYIFKRCIFGQ